MTPRRKREAKGRGEKTSPGFTCHYFISGKKKCGGNARKKRNILEGIGIRRERRGQNFLIGKGVGFLLCSFSGASFNLILIFSCQNPGGETRQEKEDGEKGGMDGIWRRRRESEEGDGKEGDGSGGGRSKGGRFLDMISPASQPSPRLPSEGRGKGFPKVESRTIHFPLFPPFQIVKSAQHNYCTVAMEIP